MMNRRRFLTMSGATGLGVAAGFAGNLASFNAYAAGNADYKALVCVFLRGGLDGHDVVIPHDRNSSREYEDVRAPIIDRYSVSRRRNNLLPLQGGRRGNGSVADGRQFALPQEYQELHELYQNGNMAIVGNVGPLIEPTTGIMVRNGSANLPPRLFSHNDQQSIWQASSPEGATAGWGGRFADMTASTNRTESFTSISTAGSQVFNNGINVNAFNLSTSGGLRVHSLTDRSFEGSDKFDEAYQHNVYGNVQDYSQMITQDIIDLTGDAVDNNLEVSNAFRSGPGVSTNFPDNGLASQLRVVAQMIANRETLGLRRQIFFVADNGYDSHSNQTEAVPERQRDIDSALAAFYRETVAMGCEDDITSFTASDFGRSLVPNSTGTDHGWGSHHMVVGGAVNGGRIYGNIPETVVGNNQDGGRGRLVPELSVDQYACALGQFYGLSLRDCRDALPGLTRFDERALFGLFS